MRFKKRFLRKIISVFASVLLLVNSFTPYLLITPTFSQVEAQTVAVTPTTEPTPTDTVTPSPTVEPTLIPTEAATPSPTAEPTAVPTEIPTPTITPTSTPEPTLEATPSPTPTVDLEPTTKSASFSESKIPQRKAGNLLKEIKKQAKENYVEGEVIVKFKKNKLNVKSLLGKAQAFAFEKKFSLEKRDEIKASNIQVFKSKKSTEEMVKELKVDTNVEYAQPNYIYEPTSISTNDTYKDLLWGLYSSNDLDIDAPEAWGISEGSGAIVAVIDSGVAYNHPDLVNNMWDGSSCKDENGGSLNNCVHGYDYEDGDLDPIPTSSSHGTHIAGTIAAEKNNGKGIIGVAPRTKIMAIKVMLSTTEIVKGISFAQYNGAKVINASWGGNTEDFVLKSAINGFQGLFIAAAGNGGDDGIGDNNEGFHTYPCDFDSSNIVCVAATEQDDTKAAFSNYGATSVDVGAPGTNIYSTGFLSEDFTNSSLSDFTNTIFTKTLGGWKTGTWGDVGFTPADDKNAQAGASYANNDASYLTLTIPMEEIVIGNNVNLSFYTYYDTEPPVNEFCNDYLAIEYDDSDNNWQTAPGVYCGSGLGYATVDIGPATSNMRMRFAWYTNETTTGYQVPVIDDIEFTNTLAYQYKDGTSMAAPHVAGLAALIEGYNPNLTSTEIKNIILSSGDPAADLVGKTVTGKRINAYNALVASAPTPTPTSTPAPTSTPTPTPTAAPNYAEIFGSVKTALSVQGIDTNIDGCASTPAGCLNLYFEKRTNISDASTALGRVTFTKSLDLSDPNSETNSFLSGLGTYMEASASASSGSMKFDARTAEQLRTAGAVIKMYGFSHGGDTDPITESELVVKNDNGVVIDPSEVTNYPSITGFTWDDVNGAVTFGTDHFTQFYVNDTTKPFIVSFSVPSTSTSLTVSGITVTAHDNRGVAGLMFSESNVPPNKNDVMWSSGTPSTYTFASAGTKTLYAWAKDAADNVSNVYSSQTVTITLAPPPNSAPSFDSIANQSISEDSSSQDILITNVSPGTGEDDQTVTMSATSSDTNIIPNPTVTGDGSTRTLTYTTVANAYGTATITVLANDGQTSNNTYSRSFNITVNPVNDGPSFDPIADVAVDEDTSQPISITGIVSGPTNESSQTVIMSATSSDANIIPNPTISSVSGGTANLTYTPLANKSGSAAITVVANDGQASNNTYTRTFTITVTAVNDSPTAVNDDFTTNEDTTYTIDYSSLLTNDSDIDGDTISISGVSNPVHGTIVNANTESKVIFTPTANFNGNASFDYTNTDGTLTSTATVTITYNPVNDAPILAAIGNKSIDEFATLTTTVSATDVDNADLTYSTSALPANATFDSATSTLSFTPVESQGGTTYNVTFTVLDGTLTDSETISITVNEVNNSPVAVDDSASVNEDEVLTINTSTLLINDYDLDSNTNAGLTISAVNTAVNGIVSLTGSTITFTPTVNFYGSASFKYTVSDGSLTDTGTVNVTVNAVNDSPILEAIGNKNVDEFSTLSIIASATDIDNVSLIYTTSTLPANATFNDTEKTFSFTPNESQGGSSYDVTFTVSDGSLTDSKTITISVNEVNNTPVATDDTATMNEDSVLTINTSTLLSNDIDLDTNTNIGLSVSVVNTPVNGAVSISGNTITFTPNADFNGTASFKYVVSDGSLTDTGTVTVTVNTINDKPVADEQTVTTEEDNALLITLIGNDIDEDILTYSKTSDPSHGSVSFSENEVTYTPSANYNGSDSFTYSANDGVIDSLPATVTITIAAVNDFPTAVNDSYTTNEGTTYAIDPSSLIANDTDVDGDTLTVLAVSNPFHGTVELENANPNGNNVIFTPEANYNGPATFDYTITDGNLTDSATVTITYNPVNDAPVANPDSTSVNEDTILTIAKLTLLANDTDVEGSSLNLIAVSNPVNGSVVIDGTNVKFTTTSNYSGSASFDYTVSDGALTNTTTVSITVNSVNDKPVASDDTASVNEDTDLTIAKSTLLGNDSDIEDDQLSVTAVSNAVNGSVSIVGNNVIFTPATNYFGSASFDYTISDAALSDTATVTITVNSVNDKPVASNGSVSTSENVAKTITLSATDTDLPVQTLTYSIDSNPLHGTLSTISGNLITYTPNTNYSGTDSFTYLANDGIDDSNIATINIIINDTIAPTVTKLGDGSSDFTLETGDTDLVFSEVLSINSKTAVENALTDGADKVLSYSWSGETLVITATQTTSFANDVMVNVSDVAGNTANSLLIVDSSLTASQTTPDSDGEATADSDSPEVVITDPEDEVTVTVEGDTEAKIDISSFINEDGDGDIPKISINSDDAEVDIPATKVTGPTGWDGVIAAPTVTTIDLPVVSGETSTLGTAIEVGFSSDKLSFDNAVRILLPGQAGKRAGYSRPGTAFTEITSVCSSDSQAAGDALGVDGECKIDVDPDLVIWTKHFTKFAAYTQTTNSTSTSSSTSSSSGTDATSAPVCNDTKPGNAPVLLSAVAGLNSVTLNWTKASDPVSYYLVTFGTKPGEQLYGNPNVGGSNTTSYTISNLSGGKTYYFKVRAGNGCMPGDYSNEITGSPSGGFIAGVPEGFAAGVLGAQDQITPTGVPIGKVAPSLVPNSAGTSPRLGFFQRVWNFILGLFKR